MSDAELTLRVRGLRREQLRRAGKARTCMRCKAEFFARVDARYCSGKCRVAAFRARAGVPEAGGR